MAKKINTLISFLIVMFLIGSVTEIRAVEVNIQSSKNDEAEKDFDQFFRDNPFPDSFYSVEIGKNPMVEHNFMSLQYNLVPNHILLTSFEAISKKYFTGCPNGFNPDQMKEAMTLRISENCYVAFDKRIGGKFQKYISDSEDNLVSSLKIKFELKDESGAVVQTETFSNFADYSYSSRYGNRNAINLSNPPKILNEHSGPWNHKFELRVPLEKIKTLTASIVNGQVKNE
ncbi:MAG: hypothetical protein HY202_04725, partial [Nitrospirae bacterium]|nr:hypothetical protein [Nitrospirota bacterium]